MNKSELIEAIADRLDSDKKTATAAVEAFVDTVTRTITKGEKVAISGFGIFEKVNRPARTGRNPQSGAPVKIKASSVPKFRPGSELKAIVNGAKKLAKAAPAKAAKPAAKAPAKKAAAKPAVKRAAAKAPAKKAPAKKAAVKAPAKKAAAKAPAKKASAKKAAKKASAKRK